MQTLPPNPAAAPPTDGGLTVRQESGFYTAYAEFAKNLRVWFLAYGIGATAIFVTNEGAGKRLLSSGAAEGVVYLFLIGVALQILVALLYKTVMWYLYMGEFDAKEKESWRHALADRISNSYSLEFVCDLATIFCFGAATYQLIKVFIK
jgi:hypothetical protein